MPGSKGRGRSQTTLGVAESKLRSESKSKHHHDLDPQALLTPEVIRQYAEACVCPWCGAGPFHVLAQHTSRAHGIDRIELRELAGLLKTASLSSPEHHANRVEHGKKHGLPEAAREGARRWAASGVKRNLSEAAKRQKTDQIRAVRLPGNSNLTAEQKAEAVTRMRAAKAAKTRQRDLLIAEKLSDESRPINDISRELGVGVHVIRAAAKRLGIYRDGRKRPAALPKKGA